MMKMPDEQQKELVAKAYVESQLVREGFEVARPTRDRGIDLIAFQDVAGVAFAAVPIQIKSYSKKGFALDRKYEGRGIVMAYVWEVLSEKPTVIVILHDEAMRLLPAKTRKTKSWRVDRAWSATHPSKALVENLLGHKSDWALLRRLGLRPTIWPKRIARRMPDR